MAPAPRNCLQIDSQGNRNEKFISLFLSAAQLRLADDLGGSKPTVRHRLAASRRPSTDPQGALHRWAVSTKNTCLWGGGAKKGPPRSDCWGPKTVLRPFGASSWDPEGPSQAGACRPTSFIVLKRAHTVLDKAGSTILCNTNWVSTWDPVSYKQSNPGD